MSGTLLFLSPSEPGLLFFLLGPAAAFAISYGTIHVYLKWALRHQVLDLPNERSSHHVPTPRGGGVGIVAAVIFVALAIGGHSGGETMRPLAAVALGAVVAAVSWIDDLRGLSAGIRLSVHIATAAVFVSVCLPLEGMATSGGWISLLVPVLVTIWIVVHINFYNFMDGIDGIAAGQASILGWAWACAGLLTGSPAIVLFGAGTAAACLAFLRFNWSPARIFLGDVGSAFLGFIAGAIPLFAAPLPVRDALIFGALASGPFLCDASVTLVKRSLRGENLTQAHRAHQYQLLVASGWSHRRVSTIYLSWAGLTALAGCIWLASLPGRATVAVLALAVPEVSLAILANIRRKKSVRNIAS